MVRRHIYFSGRVQSVGFRFTASAIAEQLHLTGWVRNCYDGKVEVEAQGSEDRIYHFIKLLQRDRFIQIDYYEMENLEVISQEKQFRIIY